MNWLPKPHILDLRSIALLRILLGFMQLFDVYSRTSNGKYDLAWYTSYPAERSYETHHMPDDYALPELLPIIFTRRSLQAEIAHFAVYTVLSICLLVGFKTRWVLPVLWLLCNAHQAKAPTLSDGSDLLLVQIMLFMCFLPSSQVWSVDAFLMRKDKLPTSGANRSCGLYKNNQVQSIACLCLTLQIVMMYLGCFFRRTFDSFSLAEIIKGDVSDWMWPNFSLVHYASNGSGTFKSFLPDMIRTTPFLNKAMTFSGFLIEFICPVMCFLSNQHYSHWGSISLFLLHFGIGQIINIPQWVQMGCAIQVIWIPTHVWDNLLGTKPQVNETKDSNCKVSSLNLPAQIREVFSLFLLYLLITTWSESRGWVSNALGHSAVAQNYGFANSNWDMWTGAPRSSPFTVILGWRPTMDGDSEDFESYEAIDLYHFIKTRDQILFGNFTDDLLDVFTYKYPSTRWEKGIGDEWEENVPALVTTMGNALCILINEDLARLGGRPILYVEFVTHTRGIQPPGSGKRWKDYDPNMKWESHVECIVSLGDEREDDDEDDEE